MFREYFCQIQFDFTSVYVTVTNVEPMSYAAVDSSNWINWEYLEAEVLPRDTK